MPCILLLFSFCFIEAYSTMSAGPNDCQRALEGA